MAPDPEVEPQREGAVTVRKEGEGTSVLGKETPVLGLPAKSGYTVVLGAGWLGEPCFLFFGGSFTPR